MKSLTLLCVASIVSCGSLLTTLSAEKKIVMLTGSPSHGLRKHEYRAGCLLLQKCLTSVPHLTVTVVSNDWPADTSVFERADAIFLFATGGDAHPAIRPKRLKVLNELMKKS